MNSFVDLLCVFYTVQKGFKDIGYQGYFSSTECLEIFSSPQPHTKVLGPTQPPVKHAPCNLHKNKTTRRGFNLPPHHVPRLRLATGVFLLPSTLSRHRLRRDFTSRLPETLINQKSYNKRSLFPYIAFTNWSFW